jgi:hypothetical protein
MPLLPRVNCVTGTWITPALKYVPVEGFSVAVRLPLVPRTAPLVISVNVMVPLGSWAEELTTLGRMAAVTVTDPEEIEVVFVVTAIVVPAFCTVKLIAAEVLGL